MPYFWQIEQHNMLRKLSEREYKQQEVYWESCIRYLDKLKQMDVAKRENALKK